jgi:transcriptional regulator GlxA family with amidase domain
MEFHRPSIEIGIVLYPDVAFATVHGLTDMFTVATTLANQRMGANAPILRVSQWRPNKTNDAVECIVMKEGAAPQIGRSIKKVMTAIFGTPSS